jgi:hypothetical protein
MTLEEQKAFVVAYSRNVASVPTDRVAEFIRRYEAGEDIEYSNDYTSIMDALGIWHDAIGWSLSK